MYKMKTDLEKLKKLQQPEPSYFVIDSIIAGHTPAKIYVDNLEDPTFSLIWEENCFYFGGQLPTEMDQVIQFIKEQLLTDEERERLFFVKLYTPSGGVWQEVLLDGFSDFERRSMDRILFKHLMDEIPDRPNIVANLQIQAIDQEILASNLGHLEEMRDEVIGMWGSDEAFLQKGFGSCAIIDHQIVCWCTGEYLSPNYCGLGIETVEEYQEQGIATLTALHCLRTCSKLGVIPHWDSWAKNLPSVKVAEKIGFEKIEEYSITGVLLVNETE